MIRLIKSELNKLIHKKGFLIVTIIFIMFCTLTNFIYKTNNVEEYYENVNIKELEEINKNLDLTNNDELYTYISNITEIECVKYKNKFNNNSKDYLIENFVKPELYNANEAKYINNNEKLYEEKLLVIDEYINNLNENNWVYFSKLKLTEINNNLSISTGPSATSTYEALKDIYEYRIAKNINYDYTNYIHNSLLELERNLPDYFTFKNKGNLPKDDQNYFNSLKESVLLNKYIIENEKDINNTSSLQQVLQNFPADFGLFILIFIIMIAGSIVSEEFNKGTIKYLLTKPYKRSTILTSKLVTVLLLIPIIIVSMVLIELIIGGIIFGFSSLEIPVVLIDSNNTLIIRTIFEDLFLNLLSVLPSYLILGVLCFMLSTITTSTSAAITITFLFYLISNVISNIALIYEFKFLKYFVSLHWDFSYLVNFEENIYNIKPMGSILTISFYLLIMLCLTYVIFNKKDVKNI